MPLPGNVHYATVRTSKGPVRLAFRGGSRKKKTGTVVEAKNIRTSATHSPTEFAADRVRRTARRRSREVHKKKTPGQIDRAMKRGRDFRV